VAVFRVVSEKREAPTEMNQNRFSRLTTLWRGVVCSKMKTRMVRWLRGAGGIFLVGGVMLFSTGCTGVVYTEGPAGVYYDCDYYPAWDVYFYPSGHIYYWNDGGHWRSGRRLPPTYHIGGEHHEQLRLHSRQPWTEHHEEHVGPVHHEEHGGPEHSHDQN